MKLFCSLAIALALVSCSPPQPVSNSTDSTNKTPAADELKAAPEFDLENIAGGTTKAADLKGKVAIVDIWATWCQPCISEIPRFNKLKEEYKDKGVEVVGITVMSPYKDIKPKAREFDMKYTVLVGNDAVVDGFGGVIGWPTTFVVTKDWKIYKRYIGARADKETKMREDIEKLLGAS